MGDQMQPNNPHTIDPLQWNSTITQLPGVHVLQSWEWGKVKSAFGWRQSYLLWVRSDTRIVNLINKLPEQNDKNKIIAAALVLQRNVRVGGFAHKMGVMYIPKGPLLDWNDQQLRKRVLQDIKDVAQRQSAIFIKIDPDYEVGVGIPGNTGSVENEQAQNVIRELNEEGWRFSEEQVQFRNSMWIDLTVDENKLLANMKQKTRYNVNLAKRKGVVARTGNPSDIDMLFQMYAETSIRDGFAIRNEEYYRHVWNTFMFSDTPKRFNQPIAEALIAEVEGEPVAAVIIFRFAEKAWYLYGMSRTTHRDRMPNYLLQWEAIKRAKEANCLVYDLWGAPNQFSQADPLWGVYRFKEGLGGIVHRFIGAWDLPLNRMLYRLYTKTLPGLLDIMRRQGRENTRQAAGGA
jgi:peptidoglycan pentaglycine glycine transferase (the first glycine)